MFPFYPEKKIFVRQSFFDDFHIYNAEYFEVDCTTYNRSIPKSFVCIFFQKWRKNKNSKDNNQSHKNQMDEKDWFDLFHWLRRRKKQKLTAIIF